MAAVLHDGCRVRLHGLNAVDLNGAEGHVVGSIEAGRFRVVLSSPASAVKKHPNGARISPHNIEMLGPAPPSSEQVSIAQQQQKWSDMLPQMITYLAEFDDHFGPDAPESNDVAAKLASLYYAVGRNAEALPLIQRSYDCETRTLGGDHPQTLATLGNLCVCMQDCGEAVQALVLTQRCYEARMRTLGPEHADTWASLSGAATCMVALGRDRDAIPFLRKCLEAQTRIIGADHNSTLSTLNSLASSLRVTGSPDALELSQSAWEGRARALGPDNVLTLTSLDNLAQAYLGNGDVSRAAVLSRRALEACQNTLGTDHPTTLLCGNNLAQALLELETSSGLAEAQRLQQHAAETGRRTLGVGHPTTRMFDYNLTDVLTTRAAVRARRSAAQLGTDPAVAASQAVAQVAHSSDEATSGTSQGAASREAPHRPQAPGSRLTEGSPEWLAEWAPAAPAASGRGQSGRGGRRRNGGRGRGQQAGQRASNATVPTSVSSVPSVFNTTDGALLADVGLAPLPVGLVVRPWKELKASHLGGNECAICLESLDTPGLLVQLRCRHTYCDLCVRQHVETMKGAAKCPECRGPIV